MNILKCVLSNKVLSLYLMISMVFHGNHSPKKIKLEEKIFFTPNKYLLCLMKQPCQFLKIKMLIV